MKCSQCGGRIKNITIRDCDERCKTKRRYSGGPTPTPPDSQVVKYFLDVLKYAIDESTQPHHARTRIKDAIDYAESQLASPEPENPTVARGLLLALKDAEELIEGKHYFRAYAAIKNGIKKAESQLASPEPENPAVARGLLETCKEIYRRTKNGEELPYNIITMLGVDIKVAESQLAEPKVLEFEIQNICGPEISDAGYRIKIILPDGQTIAESHTYTVHDLAIEKCLMVAASLGMVAKIKGVEDGDS